jgi:RNA-directed DNA polymerase
VGLNSGRGSPAEIFCLAIHRSGSIGYPRRQYGFRPRWVLFCGFTPAVSATALKAMRTTIRDLKLCSRTVSLADIARKIDPLLRGWIEYYGRYMPSALRPFLRYVNQMLRAWAMRKFKRLYDADRTAFLKSYPRLTRASLFTGSSA